uniref:Uncharacterized protein n=1 Tax=Cacopsylla melanoneura TaxID=428564 RepID=A0A8D8S469_9HEMI
MSVPLPKLTFNSLNSRTIKDFERRFSAYLEANKLTNEDEVIKIAHLKSAVDLETDELIQSFNITGETSKKILEALTNHFKPEKNLIMSQFKFFGCKQAKTENFQTFYANLKTLAAECEFGDQSDNIMKARIVLGIQDPELQK